MTKAGNSYLRYYFCEAANSIRRHIPEYQEYYAKKYDEVPKHQHKRALALTARKFVRLVFGLLAKNQLYTGEHLDAKLSTELTFVLKIYKKNDGEMRPFLRNHTKNT